MQQQKWKLTGPVCFMTAGYSSGWFSEVFGINIAAVEVSCAALGHECCRFVVAPPHKIEHYVRIFLAAQNRTDDLSSLSMLSFFSNKKDGE